MKDIILDVHIYIYIYISQGHWLKTEILLKTIFFSEVNYALLGIGLWQNFFETIQNASISKKMPNVWTEFCHPIFAGCVMQNI